MILFVAASVVGGDSNAMPRLAPTPNHCSSAAVVFQNSTPPSSGFTTYY